MWYDRAKIILENVANIISYKKSQSKEIAIDSFYELLALEKLHEVWKSNELPEDLSKSLYGYLISLPGFEVDKEIPETALNQHGYIYMHMNKYFQSLS